MSIFNEILEARYSRMLQRLFSMKGGAATRQLSGEVQPVINFFNGVENRYLEGWDRYGISMSPTGGAAQSAATKLRNPLASNVMAVVESLIVCAAGVAQNVIILKNEPGSATDLTTVQPTTNTRFDSRSRAQSALTASSTTNFGGLPGIEQWFVNLAVNQPFQLILNENQEIPILPGGELEVIDATLAANISVSYTWRERSMAESELKT